MKHLRLLALFCALFLAGCETTQPPATGPEEQTRLTHLQLQEQARQQRQQERGAQVDESDRNLWNAQMDRLNQGTNPAIRY
jgi:hypothetical protein